MLVGAMDIGLHDRMLVMHVQQRTDSDICIFGWTNRDLSPGAKAQ